MKLYFVDTSALVKRYHKEEGTDKIDEIFDLEDRVIVISNLTITETISAFKRKQNNGKISKDDLNSFISKFFFDIIRDFLVLELTGKHIEESIRLVLERNLRTLDALQLAISLDIKDFELVFVSSDKQLCKTAEEEGLNVISV